MLQLKRISVFLLSLAFLAIFAVNAFSSDQGGSYPTAGCTAYTSPNGKAVYSCVTLEKASLATDGNIVFTNSANSRKISGLSKI